MKLVSYNILDGGVGRADPLAEVIAAQRPDIVVLVEADDQAVVDRIANRLNMEAIWVQGKRHGAAILSRWGILESVNHGILNPVFSDCVLEATTGDWTVAAVHLHARATEADEVRREEEVGELLRIFDGHRKHGKPHLLAGDFNANSPVQEIVAEACKPATRKAMEANGGVIPRRAVQKLLSAGYLDSLDVVNPHTARNTGSFTTQFPGQRVDFIFTWGIEPKKITAASVEQDRLARYASDHFPVVVEVE